MSSGATNILEDLIIKHIFRTGTWAKPTTLKIKLFTAAPGEAGGGTEVTGGSYAQQTLDPLDANWAATSGGNGLTSNSSAITYPAPTANWGTVTDMAITDGTDQWIYGTLTNSRVISNGDSAPTFAIGALTVTVA
jgi:hypothetical protein